MQEILIEEIKQILPHRHPFLMVDRIVDMKPNKYAVGIKNSTFNEPFFTGHFPEHSVMPGVMIIESMAQVGGILIYKSCTQKPKNTYLASIDNVKFRHIVTPGDTLFIKTCIKNTLLLQQNLRQKLK